MFDYLFIISIIYIIIYIIIIIINTVSSYCFIITDFRSAFSSWSLSPLAAAYHAPEPPNNVELSDNKPFTW